MTYKRNILHLIVSFIMHIFLLYLSRANFVVRDIKYAKGTFFKFRLQVKYLDRKFPVKYEMFIFILLFPKKFLFENTQQFLLVKMHLTQEI